MHVASQRDTHLTLLHSSLQLLNPALGVAQSQLRGDLHLDKLLVQPLLGLQSIQKT